MDASGIDAAKKGEGGSGTALESAELSPRAAPADGFGASLAKRLNAGTNRTASVTVVVIFIRNLIVVSNIARRDCRSISSPERPNAKNTYQTPR
jgi:hypothetical protein